MTTLLLDCPADRQPRETSGALPVVTLASGDTQDLTGLDTAALVRLQFDQEQLKPTYRVLDDQPGRSFALAIARRWGIPPEVVDRAESVIGDEERKGTPRQLFWPWFAANVSVLGLSYGSFVLGFGISFWQAVVVGVIGIGVSFLL